MSYRWNRIRCIFNNCFFFFMMSLGDGWWIWIISICPIFLSFEYNGITYKKKFNLFKLKKKNYSFQMFVPWSSGLLTGASVVGLLSVIIIILYICIKKKIRSKKRKTIIQSVLVIIVSLTRICTFSILQTDTDINVYTISSGLSIYNVDLLVIRNDIYRISEI